MPDFTTDAIVLKTTDYGDWDTIISFFSRSNGKISVMAKNAKKSVKRFSGTFDLFCENHIQCSFPKKKKDGMINLTGSDLENGFANIRYDVVKTGYASFWMELLYYYLEENKSQADIYELLLLSLNALDKGSIPKQVLNLLFQIKFMSLAGFSPNLKTCGACQKNIDDFHQKRIRFDFKDGVILCNDCLKQKQPKDRSPRGMTVSKGTLKQLFWINTTDIQKADRIRFSDYAIKEGGILLEAFIPFHMGRDFKSLTFLKRISEVS